MKFAAVILAAGQGQRMQTSTPKVLHLVGGRAMVLHVIEHARAAGAERIVAVLGVGREKVEALLPPGVETVFQAEQLGTGHAARCAAPLLDGYPGTVAVLYGDVPLLRAETIAALVRKQAETGAAAALLTAIVRGPHAYGRIVRDGAGGVRRIVEHKDATEAERRIEEVNVGVYAFGPGQLFPVLRRLRNENSQREYYLTDAAALLAAAGKRVEAVKAEDAEECLGINTPEELAAAEARYAAGRSKAGEGAELY
jgi:bifunctional UDP-N-acetylglucosamine pyrophosphorylase/glucosamine-1-phosphate N-acetyltransferase